MAASMEMTIKQNKFEIEYSVALKNFQKLKLGY
jgi:hypothetical protein